MRRAGDGDRLERLVAADPMIDMDDEITRRQRCGLADELVEVATAPAAAGESVAEDILFAEQDEVLGREALLDRQYREPDRRTRQRRKRLAVGDAPKVGNAALAQHGQQAVGRAFAECGDGGFASGRALGFEI